MKNNRDVLSSILKTVQIGQTGIRSVLDMGMQSSLRKELEAQLQEYSAIEMEAHTIASQRGWELRDLDPAVRFLTDVCSRARVNGRNTDSIIAGMVIRRSTNGMIQGLKDIHRLGKPDPQVQTISQRLLDREAASVQQMKGYL